MSYRANNSQLIRSLNLGLPEGPLARKYKAFRESLEFRLTYFVGPYATGKTKAGIDACIIHAASFPGAHVGICRSTLKSLKSTTLMDLKERGGGLIHSISENEGMYRLVEDQYCRATDKMLESTITGFGIDKTSDQDWMGSLELSFLFIDEADTTDHDRRHKLMGRVRKKVYHKELEVQDYSLEMASRWGVTPEESAEILFFCPNTNFRRLAPDHPMPGQNQVKMVYNPKGMSDIWKDSFMDIKFPFNGFTEEWVAQNTGIFERHVEPEELIEDKFKFGAGDILITRNGKRYFVKIQDGPNIHTISEMVGNTPVKSEQVINMYDAGLAQQQETMYAFSWENESRDKSNIRMSYLIDRKVKDKYMSGSVKEESEYVFPEFIEDYHPKGHIWDKRLSADDVMKLSRRGIGGIDDGIAHACGGVLGMQTSRSKTLVLFKEYLVSNRFALENATNLNHMIPTGGMKRLPVTWGYDPAMDSRQTLGNGEFSTPKEAYESILSDMVQGDNGDKAFAQVSKLLKQVPEFYRGSPLYGMLVTEDCPEVIEALKSLTWTMVHQSRNNSLVDIADALKFCCSVHNSSLNRSELSETIMPVSIGVGSY